MKTFKKPTLEFIDISDDIVAKSNCKETFTCTQCYCGLVGPCPPYDEGVQCATLSELCDIY